MILLTLIFGAATLPAASDYPTFPDILRAMGAQPIGDAIRFFGRRSAGRWRQFTAGSRAQGDCDPVTLAVRSIDLANTECDRIDKTWTGKDRASLSSQATKIATLFVERIRKPTEKWTVGGVRVDFGVRGIPNRTAVHFHLQNVDGYSVNSQSINLTAAVLKKSGVICRAYLPSYKIMSTTDSIGEAKARRIAESYRFQSTTWETTGKRGAIVKLQRFLTNDRRIKRNVFQDPIPLVRAWRAYFEKYNAYVTIDARDGSIVGKDLGHRPHTY